MEEHYQDSSHNIDELKRFLFRLPAEQQFYFSNHTRKTIRKQLFQAISCGGKFLPWFFPNAFPDLHSAPTAEGMLQTIHDEFDSSYSVYYKTSLHKRDPKFNSHNHHAFHSGSPCARIFRKGEPIYRCLTCGYDDTCALCSHCYVPEAHANHNVHIAISLRENGGVCDCGDPEAWVNEFPCPYASNDREANILRNSTMPVELETAFLRTMETILDYVIDVMTHSDLQFTPANELTNDFVDFYSTNSELDSTKYGFDDPQIFDLNSEEFCLMIYNDQNRHYREAVQRVRLASRKVKEFAIMVTDKAQEFGKAKVVTSVDVDVLKERQRILAATGIATSIRSSRDVFREDMCDEILNWISELTESEMFKISNSVKNTFCKAFCRKWRNGLRDDPKIHQWLLYNTGSLDFFNQIPKIPSSRLESDRNPASSHWKFVPKKWRLDPNICRECEYNLNTDDYDLHKNHIGSRLQYFCYLDIRFWRSIRLLLHDMYSTSLITNLKYKNIIACQYVDIYPTITDMFLLKDREPELSLMSTLSTQLFTCPSNSSSIVEHGDLARIFAAIYGFFTDDKIKSPQNVEVTHQISLKSLRNRRWGQIFFDIGYILSRNRHAFTVLSPDVIAMACDILALFQGRPVLKRESKNHVEFENPEYSSFFQSVSVIYQFAESTAHSLNNLKDVSDETIKALSKRAIADVFTFLLNLEVNKYPGLTDETIDVSLVPPKADGTSDNTSIENYSIDSGKVSFLHPIHSFASWLLESSSFNCIEVVREVLDSTCSQFSQAENVQISPTVFFEYSIRTIVLMSQIKSGLWVRNGFGIRSQLQLYKNTSLRESGYMRDLFMIQLFSNLYSPKLVCFTILNRWQLLNEAGDGTALTYDSKTLSYMLEECLNFFIHLLTEDLYLRSLPDKQTARTRIETEIIQNLCFEPVSYTKLCSQIPDHIVIDKRFDIVLHELTIFTPPNTSKDVGSYRLKDKYFERVNPYYFNYSANTRDDAVKLIKEKVSTTKKIKMSQATITPCIRDPSELGMYKYVGNFSISSYFEDFIITNLLYVEAVGIEKADSLLETMLHLLHICSYESTLNVEKYGSFFDVIAKGTENSVYAPFGNSYTIASFLYKFLSTDCYKEHHSKIRAIFTNFIKKYDVDSLMNSLIEDYDNNKLHESVPVQSQESEMEVKKRMAKEKQAKLMAKFKKQQSSFLRKNKMSNIETSDTELEEEDTIGWSFPEPHCILCQDTAQNSGAFGIISYVSKSSEFRSVPFDDKYWFLKAFSDGCNLNEDETEVNENIFTSNWMSYMDKIKEDNVLGPGFASREHVDSKLVSSSCGHGMHFSCYLSYLNNNRNRQNQITRNSPDNPDHKEFLCPLCKAINNMFVPILWTNNKRSMSEFLKPGPIDNGDLSVFDSLKQMEISRSQYFPGFMKAARKSVEEFSTLSPSAKKVIDNIFSTDTNSDDSRVKQTFNMLLSNMSSVMTFFSFPNSSKADAPSILVNTIKSFEISLRGESSNGLLVHKQLTNNALINLRSLAEFRNSTLYMKTRDFPEEDSRKYDVYVGLVSNLLSFHSNSSFIEKVLEQDFFELLVKTFPVPEAGFSFNVILRATFMAHVIQTIYLISKNILSHNFYQCLEYTILDVPVISTVDEEKAHMAAQVFRRVRKYLIPDDDEDMIANDNKFGFIFYSMLLKACTPFIRRATIYTFVCCADDGNYNGSEEIFLEADRLCDVAGIDSVHTLLSKFLSSTGSFEQKKFNAFFENLHGTNGRSEDHHVSLEYPGQIKLIDLPERLDFFFTKFYYSDKYDKPHTTIEDPAVCLFCGQVVDVQRCAIGSPLGECSAHLLKECPNNIGIFLLPKDKAILLLHKNGGSFTEAPYLDSHGELPVESKRSNTLYLMKPRYNGLIRNAWLNHNIPNLIVRKLDHVIDAGGWNTL
ncbi:hypothetical protein CANTEDRAFT_123730 [Yamadazyma tenuis ATCC 10573]|uniref:E3 ubiquitin-protein ligase n=1 Tax=Candida tenuis (strain ATCC 10573 / BCRC 21748 / CBS 615 / JCM 9827 / NBRC 10315 / NRRL Y-1498 / VKM Y-70) TaxID=590646 RepID=G3B6E6_CANTC|nr:uncharacterized protein CANTEDRAFT_123730 [Yamadazyma tenuis ATCC 10573]EGV63447.1 hypothetical protein CANTEDRAFT_123730 [Yamadazyma tenuis ATCC 10573]